LFWKQKNFNADINKSLFSLDAVEHQNEKRTAFRVVPINKYPIYAKFNGHEMEVVDISAAGVSCKGSCSGNLTEHFITIQAGSVIPETVIDVDIIESSENGCRLAFRNLSKKTKNQIHLYALKVQKTIVQEKKDQKT